MSNIDENERREINRRIYVVLCFEKCGDGFTEKGLESIETERKKIFGEVENPSESIYANKKNASGKKKPEYKKMVLPKEKYDDFGVPMEDDTNKKHAEWPKDDYDDLGGGLEW